MVGEPCPESVGQKLEQFIVVLAGAAALPGGLARRHFTQHSRLSAHRDSDFRQRQRTSIPIPVGFRLSALGSRSPHSAIRNSKFAFGK